MEIKDTVIQCMLWHEATCEQELVESFDCLNEDLHTFTLLIRESLMASKPPCLAKG